MRAAYHIKKPIVIAVAIAQTIIRNPIPEKTGTPAMPCAIPTLKGFRNAAAKPTCEPTKGMATPVIES